MNPQFNAISTSPENDIFQVVFFPDRIYHSQYLNATRSDRYRYNVQEVRGAIDINVLKGEVYFDGQYYTNFIRIEYRASRLVEVARLENRFVRGQILAFVQIKTEDERVAQATVKLRYDAWVNAYQGEIWGTLEAPANNSHDIKVLDMMGYRNQITRIPSFSPLLENIKAVKQVELAFRENDRDLPFGFTIDNPAWDNNFGRTFQAPNTSTPSSPQNTVPVLNYLLNFQRGWFMETGTEITPIRYLNALIEPANPDFDPTGQNVIEMRWIVQREFGSSVVFFHEVTIPPGKTEGTHRHIGSEELYYITEGEGIAYMAVGDDPKTEKFPTVTKYIFGIGNKDCKELPVKPGSVIYTKSGGIHGIRNPGTVPLKFVAFLYHSS